MSDHPHRLLATIKARTVISRSACGQRQRVMQYNIYSINFYPHWVPKYPSGVYLSLYVFISVSLSGPLRLFLVIIWSARNCVQRMRPQAKVSNILSGSIIFPSAHPSVCPVICGPFAFFVFVLISIVLVHRCNAFIPQWGTVKLIPQWGTVKVIYLPLCLVVNGNFWN